MSAGQLPRHVGIIMDGNRRWARGHGLTALEGHKKGSEVFLEITDYLHRQGIACVTVYAFSTENWSRTQQEVGYLMHLAVTVLRAQLKKLHDRGARLRIVGTYDRVDPKVARLLQDAEEMTKNNTNGTLCICFNYGGQQEIVDAAKNLLIAKVHPESLTTEVFEQHLYHADVPPLDLIIRTSGEQRLSGFMLWRAAYAELLFVDTLWPDFSTADVDAALAEYGRRQRRFGK